MDLGFSACDATIGIGFCFWDKFTWLWAPSHFWLKICLITRLRSEVLNLLIDFVACLEPKLWPKIPAFDENKRLHGTYDLPSLGKFCQATTHQQIELEGCLNSLTIRKVLQFRFKIFLKFLLWGFGRWCHDWDKFCIFFITSMLIQCADFVAQSFIGKLAIILVFRALGLRSSVYGAKIMAKKSKNKQCFFRGLAGIFLINLRFFWPHIWNQIRLKVHLTMQNLALLPSFQQIRIRIRLLALAPRAWRRHPNPNKYA